MFNSSIIDVVIGLVFTFLGVSLVSSALLEAANSLLKLRSTMLLAGVQRMVDDPQLKSLALMLYQHAVIAPAGAVTLVTTAKPVSNVAAIPSAAPSPSKVRTKRRLLPGYIDSGQFANALMDIAGLSGVIAAASTSGSADVGALLRALDASPIADGPLRGFLTGVIQRAQGDVAEIRKGVAAWFDAGMDRLSGVYKRWTQLFTFLIGFGVAVTVNADTVTIVHELWVHPELVEALKVPDALKTTEAPGHDSVAPAALAMLNVMDQHLPIGWSPGHPFKVDSPEGVSTYFWAVNTGPHSWWTSVIGWSLTAFATLFGAPFWFDLLQTVVRLKGAGPSPDERRAGQAASV